MTLIHPFAPRSDSSRRVSIILVTHHKVGQIVFSVRVPAMVVEGVGSSQYTVDSLV